MCQVELQAHLDRITIVRRNLDHRSNEDPFPLIAKRLRKMVAICQSKRALKALWILGSQYAAVEGRGGRTHGCGKSWTVRIYRVARIGELGPGIKSASAV